MSIPPAERPVDRRGYYRSPVTLQSYRQGQAPANKGKKYPPEPLRPREVLALIDACGRGAVGRRNRAMIALMWRSGLRVSEVLALYPKDVDVDECEVRVLHGKGDQARTAGLDADAGAIVERWAELRRELGFTWRHPLFCTIKGPTRGGALYGAYVRNMLKESAARAGIEKRVHPHGLRHTHAYELANERTDLRLIKRQLGHSNLAVTARYVEHLAPREVVEAIRARPWPGPGLVAAPPSPSPRAAPDAATAAGG